MAIEKGTVNAMNNPRCGHSFHTFKCAKKNGHKGDMHKDEKNGIKAVWHTNVERW